MTDDRAVSEVLGFILVFALIGLSVATVYVAGFNGLQDSRNAQQIDNVERAFDVLADNIEDLTQQNAPNRATEFRLYDARLLLGNTTEVTVTVTNLPDTQASTQNDPIVYESRRSPTTIRYIAGATIRDRRGNGIFLTEPNFVFRENASGYRTAVIPIIQTRSASREAVRGTKTVLVRTDIVADEVLIERTTPSETAAGEYEVQLRVNSTGNPALWESYLDQELTSAYSSLSDPCSVSGDDVTCEFETERIYVTASRVDTEITS